MIGIIVRGGGVMQPFLVSQEMEAGGIEVKDNAMAMHFLFCSCLASGGTPWHSSITF